MRLLPRSLAFAVAIFATGAILPNVSQAQVVPAIKGGGSQINVYGLYAIVNPDGDATLNYPQGVHYPSNFLDANAWNFEAGSVGADFRLGRFIFGQPALGARITFSTGGYAKENTYMFGPEMHYAWHKFRPYGNFFIGKGDITYKDGTGKDGATDDSIVYQLGGGVDYHINHRFSVRMFDFQYQFWNLGVHTYPPGLLPGVPEEKFATTLQPYTLSFGVLVRVR